MVYDGVRNSVLLSGGKGSGGAFLEDLWEWNGSSWTEARISLKAMNRTADLSLLEGGRGAELTISGTIWSNLRKADAAGDAPPGFPANLHAVHVARFDVPSGSSFSEMKVGWTGSGAGPDISRKGSISPGAGFHIWDWNSGEWKSVGSIKTATGSCNEPEGGNCTISSTFAGDFGRFAKWGRVWLMAMSKHPCLGSTESEIVTDHFGVNFEEEER